MNNVFNGWEKINDLSLDTVIDLIVTGRNSKTIVPDNWLCELIGNVNDKCNILDFGCGIGRNSFNIAKYSDKWNVIGYDNDGMLSKIPEYSELHYKNETFSNLKFLSDWDACKLIEFDIIVCSLVLQHIHEDILINYLNDFKLISKKLIISGRRFNDDMVDGKYKNTWEIIEKAGLIPFKTLNIKYDKYGDLNQHMTCIYESYK